MSNKIRKKKKRTTAAKFKTLGVMFKGIVVSWTTADPLSEASLDDMQDTKITHKKMQYRNLVEVHNATIREYIQQGEHSWFIDVDLLMHDKEHDVEYEKGVTIAATCPFHDIDDDIGAAIETLLAGANLKHYVTTRMTCEIV